MTSLVDSNNSSSLLINLVIYSNILFNFSYSITSLFHIVERHSKAGKEELTKDVHDQSTGGQ